MAKVRPIPDLRADDAYGGAAAKILSVRSQELADHSRGVLDMGDIERVHDMRVATRRLRAALEVFAPCFPKKAHRAALREVKELADALGERRDRDVAIDALEDFAGRLEGGDRDGVESLIGSLRMQQLQANDALRPQVSIDRVTRLRASLDDLASRAKGTKGGRP
jgi:CHAD domain-containing protein